MHHAYDFLRIPEEMSASVELYYNRSTRVIVLEGPRGKLLAHYASHILPDARRHQFYTCYPKDYTPFDGLVVPPVMKADVTSLCWPVERLVDARATVKSGAPGSLSADTSPGPGDLLLTPLLPPEALPTMDGLPGLRIGPSAIEAHADGAGFTLARGGLRLAGPLTNPGTTSKGLTRESPLFGVLPKTIVTFWGADYLFDAGEVRSFVGYVSQALKLIESIQALVRLISRMP